MSGTTLAQLDRRQTTLEVACTKCTRRGRYHIANLIKTHGAAMTLPDLCDQLSSDCRNVDAFAVDRCNIFFPNLKQPD